MQVVVDGVVAFSNLTKHEEYQGRSTGKYSLVLELNEENKELLMSHGVKVKDYKGTPQRKFSTKFNIKVVDTDNNTVEGEIPWGSKVNLIVSFSKPSPVYGVTPYLQAVRLVERSDNTAAGRFIEVF